ncbi:hypothetical protein LPC08_17605 [Roseomonas sp. OT10]|uniref:replication protein RepA n=1 Tax=Roseomonas cutis TaxID=2897332 RepID=UPI001E4A1E85|nr:replication protein RepA [Roseomonas sp. OT10]UFN47815.1 hypothetical protein LPC08_17605 [Roseomonas sp. OT10]
MNESSPSPAAWQAPDILWHHAAFCRMALPLQIPSGPAWSRDTAQGALLMDGPALPGGPALRLLLLHLFTAALRSGTAAVPIGTGIEAVPAALGLAPAPRLVEALRDQLMRLLGAKLRVAEGRQAPLPLLDARSVRSWTDPTEWRPTLRLNERFLASLRSAAVPLDRSAVARLGDAPAALDAYAWLAATLPGVAEGRMQLPRWEALRSQFGEPEETPAAFQARFTAALQGATAAYPAARIAIGEEGVALYRSPLPVEPALPGAPPRPVAVTTQGQDTSAEAAPVEAAPAAPVAPAPAAVPAPAPAVPDRDGAEPAAGTAVAVEAVPVPAPRTEAAGPPATPSAERPPARRHAPEPRQAAPAPRGAPPQAAPPQAAPPQVAPPPAAATRPAAPPPPQERPQPAAPRPAPSRPDGGRQGRSADRVRLPPSVTGLPQAVWLKRGDTRESITIEVTPGAEYDPARRSLLAIEPIVLQVSGYLVPRELERIAAWVTTNAGVIQDYWDWSIDSGEEVMQQVRRVPTSRW